MDSKKEIQENGNKRKDIQENGDREKVILYAFLIWAYTNSQRLNETLETNFRKNYTDPKTNVPLGHLISQQSPEVKEHVINDIQKCSRISCRK